MAAFEDEHDCARMEELFALCREDLAEARDTLAREKARADEAEAGAAAKHEALLHLFDCAHADACDNEIGCVCPLSDSIVDKALASTAGRALLAERDRLREVVQEALPFIEHAAREDVNYGGYPVVEDPRDFSPDPECCTPEEIAAHKAACEAWERGERPTREPTHETIADGETLIRLTRAPWGIGVSTLRDPQAVALLAQVRAALSGERGGEVA